MLLPIGLKLDLNGFDRRARNQSVVQRLLPKIIKCGFRQSGEVLLQSSPIAPRAVTDDLAPGTVRPLAISSRTSWADRP